MRTQDFETNRVEPGSKQGRGFIPRGTAKDGQEGFLCQFFGVCAIGNPSPENPNSGCLYRMNNSVNASVWPRANSTINCSSVE
jgi:hypothetical protein